MSTWPSWIRSSTTAINPGGRTIPLPARSSCPSINSIKLKYPRVLPLDTLRNIRNLSIFIQSRSARWMMVIENYGRSIVKLFRVISNTKNLENTNLSRTKIAILLKKLSRRIKITFFSRRSSKKGLPFNMTKASWSKKSLPNWRKIVIQKAESWPVAKQQNVWARKDDLRWTTVWMSCQSRK